MRMPKDDYRTMVRDKLQDFPIQSYRDLRATVGELRKILHGREYRVSLRRESPLRSKLEVVRDLLYKPEEYVVRRDWRRPFREIAREEIDARARYFEKILRQASGRSRKRPSSEGLRSLIEATAERKRRRQELERRRHPLPSATTTPKQEDDHEREQLRTDLERYQIPLETIYSSSNEDLRTLRARHQLAYFGLGLAQSATIDRGALHSLRDDIYRREGYHLINLENAKLLILEHRIVTAEKLLRLGTDERRALLRHAYSLVVLLSQPKADITLRWILNQPAQARIEILERSDSISALTKSKVEGVEQLLQVEQQERERLYSNAVHLGELFSLQSRCPDLPTLLQMGGEERAWWVSSARALCQLYSEAEVDLDALFEEGIEDRLVARQEEYIAAYKRDQISVEQFLREASA